MKHLQTYKIFEASQELSPEQVEFLDEYATGKWSINSQTGLVDVDGYFNCSDGNLKDFKGIRFGNVTEYFICSHNQLETLKGAPAKVGGGFYCNSNLLKTLEGAPEKVGENFYCHENRLKTLEGAPAEVGHGFFCSSNHLETLEGAPTEVGGNFYCTHNRLETLEGAPTKVEREFYCYNNPLKSLEGAPTRVGDKFSCDAFDTDNWTLEGQLEILETGSPKAKALMKTIISPEAIQKRIDRDPSKAAVELKGIWKTLKGIPGYEDLKFPEGHSEEVDLLSDLDGIGL